MTMLVDTKDSNVPFEEIKAAMTKKGEEMGLDIHIQREDIFVSMHKL